MSTTSAPTIAELASLQAVINGLDELPYCTGTVALDMNASTLFYQSGDLKAEYGPPFSDNHESSDYLTKIDYWTSLRQPINSSIISPGHAIPPPLVAINRMSLTNRTAKLERWMPTVLQPNSPPPILEYPKSSVTCCCAVVSSRRLSVWSFTSLMSMVMSYPTTD